MSMKKLYKAFTMKATSLEPGMIVLSPEQIKQLHEVLLEIVDDIMDVCDEEHLTCLLGGGSALGAIRHHGFIPWDDDMDINMPRSSYDKFIPAFKKKYGERYHVHTPDSNPEYGTLLCKIRLKGTVLKTSKNPINDAESCIFVDIFPVENVPDNAVLRTLHGLAANAFKMCTSCRKVYFDRKTIKKKTGKSETVGTAMRIRLIIGFLCSFMSVEKWTLTTSKIFSMCKNQNTKLVTIPPGRWHYFGSFHERKSFCVTRRVPFDGRMLPICEGIDDYMKILYGESYMQVPPENKRETHGCWAFDVGDALQSQRLSKNGANK